MPDLSNEVAGTSIPTATKPSGIVGWFWWNPLIKKAYAKSPSRAKAMSAMVVLTFLGSIFFIGVAVVLIAVAPKSSYLTQATAPAATATGAPSAAPVDLVSKYANSAPKSLVDRLAVWRKLPGVYVDPTLASATSNEAMVNLLQNWQAAYDHNDPRYLWGLTFDIKGIFYSNNKMLASGNRPSTFHAGDADLPANGSVTRDSPMGAWDLTLTNGQEFTSHWTLRFQNDHWIVDERYGQ
jgi:hypothetical protein